jgi:hypothetical protein
VCFKSLFFSSVTRKTRHTDDKIKKITKKYQHLQTVCVQEQFSSQLSTKFILYKNIIFFEAKLNYRGKKYDQSLTKGKPVVKEKKQSEIYQSCQHIMLKN